MNKRKPKIAKIDPLHPIVTHLSLDARAVGGGWTVDLTIERERLWVRPPQTLKVERAAFIVFSYDYQNRHLIRGVLAGLKDFLATGKAKRRPL